MPRTIEPDFSKPPERFRAAIARGLAEGNDTKKPRVERDGGLYGAGIIRGFAVITRGEALGHGLWIDNEFVAQTNKAMAALSSGLKSRFTHPGLSSDGLGKLLGKGFDGQQDGDLVRADLHILESAHNTPDGDLATYVMDMAEESPEMFGSSIVYKADFGEEERFAAEHTDEDGNFTSPDPDNVKNLPHARLGRLLAVDIVDSPAANPDGMFSADAIHADADALALYAFGITEDAPELAKLGADPERVRGFITRFLNAHDLTLEHAMTVKPEETKPEETKPTKEEGTKPEATNETEPAADSETVETSEDDGEGEPEPEAEPAAEGETIANGRGDAVAELRKFTKAFGQENGVGWFSKGFSFQQAEDLHAELGRMRAEVSTEANSETSPLSANDGEPEAVSGYHNSLGAKLGGYAESLKMPTK